MNPAASAPVFSNLLGALPKPPMLSILLLRYRLSPVAVSSSPLTRSPLRVLAAAMSSSASSSSAPGGRKPNRLAAEHSPYLLQHAHNPVDWYPWGDEAFEKARAKDVPIFLSSMSSHIIVLLLELRTFLSSFWGPEFFRRCHVMEVESFENEEVAKLLNDWFVSIKVDREERPDVDKELDFWSNFSSGRSRKPGKQNLMNSYDPKFGGFGSAPKFPRPVEAYIMLYAFRKHMEAGKDSEAQNILKMVMHTLDCMARGGVHDHVGGGFHRYSVDECWHVPHFEKMLYDQGQIVNVYLDTFMITGDENYSTVARDILDYLRRDMIGKEGEIFSAEDADSAEYEGAQRKKEGAFYVWTSKEIEGALGKNAELFKNHYYVKSSGNCDLSRMSDPHNEFSGKNVLIERKPTSSMASKCGKPVDEYSQILGGCRHKLFDVRSKRPRPHLDDKVIVSWNGLAISAFARASQILKSGRTGTRFNFPVTGCNVRLYASSSG
ncbi:hypothetical protein PR202_ga08374 [Eleusine coracana subsp. coracana]|uniref:Spermatogenesis-associated protein 20-like TRX domain-containing protein n=1 Tax=Eleusine coracana subsp. coracana TaxID=191504 RepID=A0AAV5BZV6_ELECO|nr:hypothetical protein PR202_ga08374 [Eleusine coracana subsp. coracana]